MPGKFEHEAWVPAGPKAVILLEVVGRSIGSKAGQRLTTSAKPLRLRDRIIAFHQIVN